MTTPSTELTRAFEMMQKQLPNQFVCVEERIVGTNSQSHEFRLSVVNDYHNAFGFTAETVDAAFARVVEDYDKPRTREINRAKQFLAAEGYEVSKINNPAN